MFHAQNIRELLAANSRKRLKRTVLRLSGAVLFGILLQFRADGVEVVTNDQLVITSIAAQGTNLNFYAVVPTGMSQVMLEMRPTLDAPWQDVFPLNFPQGAGPVSFSIPKPEGALAFFRLKATAPSAGAPQVSAELRYATMPSLVSSFTEATFHFKGTVDGSDRILITRAGALWDHVHWGWPNGAVAINDSQWNPQEKSFLTTVGTSMFLPEPFSLDSAELEVAAARDVVALERLKDGLMIYVDDTPSGSGEYDFTVRFHPANSRQGGTGAAARLKIAARIDGSDSILITATEATWKHHAFQSAQNARLNDIGWSLDEGEVLKNEGSTRFLPPGIDFSTARVIGRKGRDLATMWAEQDSILVRFADNPNGSDDYELEISFGQ